jgi:Fe2+ transport system protein FeoA
MPEIPLSQLVAGQAGKVLRLEGQGGARQRLQEMGIICGTSVEFVRVAPLGDPIEVKVRGYRLTLRKQEADGVIVDVAALGSAP